jgi:hypothetical protein
LIYALREVMPVSAAGVLYLLPVLLASSYGGLGLARLRESLPERLIRRLPVVDVRIVADRSLLEREP